MRERKRERGGCYRRCAACLEPAFGTVITGLPNYSRSGCMEFRQERPCEIISIRQLRRTMSAEQPRVRYYLRGRALCSSHATNFARHFVCKLWSIAVQTHDRNYTPENRQTKDFRFFQDVFKRFLIIS